MDMTWVGTYVKRGSKHTKQTTTRTRGAVAGRRRELSPSRQRDSGG